MTPATLVFAWGNPGRGDDALGPLFAERIAALGLPGVECLTDFQLQVEHALDLQGRQRVLFVDAALEGALDGAAPFALSALTPRRDASFTTHAMSPAAILQVYAELEGQAPPPAWQLAIRGQHWELGQPPSAGALQGLEQALGWAQDWLTAQPAAPGAC
jgi:hydrogenase maturation protease